MINFKDIQSECHSIAKHLGYKTDKRSTILHLKKEIKELNYCNTVINHNELSTRLANTQDDKEFFLLFNETAKATDLDELPDPVNIILSHCEERGIDFETIFMNKLRYNKLRNKIIL